ncbi:MAG: prohibitin family protein [Cytophagales bacterium]|nr:MAG: prohibitin family protein [Cytophagales bacterium]
MFLAIIGITILIIVFFIINKSSEFYYRFGNLIKSTGGLLIVLGFLLASVIQIGTGEVGVQSLYGNVNSEILESGLHLINPLVEVKNFDKKTQNYTMSSVHDEGDKNGDDAIRVLTADGLEVGIDLTILYRVIPAKTPEILKQIGIDYKNVVVRPITRTKIRDNAVYYDAVSLYSTKRNEFQTRIYNDIEKDFKNRGIQLEQLLIRNINLPESVKQTIESKINAEQESQKMKFVLDKERQEADRKRVEAQGIADYQKIMSNGLTDKQLQYEMIKAQKDIAISPNTKIIIMSGGKSSPIILSADK